MRFIINDKLSFIASFRILKSSLLSWDNIGKGDFRYLSQEFDNIVLDLVKRKELCP